MGQKAAMVNTLRYGGLSSAEAQSRLLSHGQNALSSERAENALMILARQFKNIIIFMLFGAAGISYMLDEHVEFVIVLLIIVITVLIGFFEEYKASRDMEALKRLTPRTARVLRDSKETTIDAAFVVVDDIILLRRGEIVSADARLLSSEELLVDESALTGESNAVEKSIASPNERGRTVFSGAAVLAGEAVAKVQHIGHESEIGKIATMMSGIELQVTPLQRRLDRLGKQFSVIVFAICIGILLLGIARGSAFSASLLLAVSVAVAGIPESLPAVIGVALAIGTKRMAKQGAIIKRLPVVETLGTCTIICTDKTGTLTQNKMVIESIYTPDVTIQVTGEGFSPEGLFLRENETIDPKKHHAIQKMLEIGTLCNNSTLEKRGGEWCINGESTEGALVVLARKAGIDREDLHTRCPRVHEHPFDPTRKLMSSVHLVKKKPIVYAKGAPEMILLRCKQYLAGGGVHAMTTKMREEVTEQQRVYATQGMRVLALAYKEHQGKTYEIHRIESGLIFVGLVAMRDPPAPGVKEAIAQCEAAGIWTVMITGDNEITATAIAEDLGIYASGDRVVSGEDLDRMSDDAFAKIANEVAVFARMTPAHKLRIVKALQTAGNIVAMTGDGVNDAPALKKADIGVAMGKRGTEVAKEAADMVITDDHFATIAVAVREGRTIYANIRKFIYYMFAANFSEVLLILIATLLGVLPPLTPIMILFINLVTSDVPAMGLCFERPPEKVMRQRPRNPKEGVLNEYLFFKIGQVVPVIVLGTIVLFIWEYTVHKAPILQAQTVAFVTIIFFELFHAFNAKSWDETAFSRKTFTNPVLYAGYAVSILLTIAAVYVPAAQDLFGTYPLALSDWLVVLAVTFSIILFTEIQKTAINAELAEHESLSPFTHRKAK